MRPRLSFEWLHACCGCEIALLNSGELLLGLLERVEIVHFPLLMDHKYQSRGETFDLPEAEIGVVSGGVADRAQLAMLKTMRARCHTLIGLGTCATHGGIPALRNQWSVETTLDTVYGQSAGEQGLVPVALAAPLDRVYSVDEQVRLDLCLPGCPPRPETIVEAIVALIDHNSPRLPRKSVCETCPAQRQGKGAERLRRFLDNADHGADEPVERMRCLLEQGLLCMGPVTAGGCGGQEAPLCIQARVPCRGCYGPVRTDGNPLLDMLGALASNGIEYRGLVDRKSLLRFSGAHGLLKPQRRPNLHDQGK